MSTFLVKDQTDDSFNGLTVGLNIGLTVGLTVGPTVGRTCGLYDFQPLRISTFDKCVIEQ